MSDHSPRRSTSIITAVGSALIPIAISWGVGLLVFTAAAWMIALFLRPCDMGLTFTTPWISVLLDVVFR
jgi:hypothetical protein